MILPRPLKQQFSQHKPWKIPLRLVLTVPFVLLTVGTTGLVGYLCFRNGQETVEDLAHQLMAETGDRVNFYLTDYLETPQLANRLNVNAVRLNQIDISDSENLRRHFVQQIQAFPSVSRIHFSNPQGGYVSAGNDERGLSLATTPNFTKGTLQVYGVDQQGNRQELLVERSNYDASQRPFYQQAVKASKPVWSSIYVYVPASRGLGISASYPLYNAQRQLQGVLSSDLTLADISRFLTELRAKTRGTVFIIERSGLLVASSTPEKPFFTHPDNGQIERLKASGSQEPIIRQSTQHLLEQFGDLSQISNTEQLSFEINGKRQFLQVMPFRDETGLDWLIVTTVPEVNFMGRIQANTQNAIALSAVALTGSILLGLWLAHWIARPIQRLSRASSFLANEEWKEPLREDSPITELQVLTQAFNQTSIQLQQSFDQVRTALQASEEKFATIFRTCPDPIGILSLDGDSLEVNDAFVSLSEYTRDEILGHKASTIGQPMHWGDWLPYTQRLQAGERISNQEYSLQKQSGEWATLLVSAESIHLQGQPCILVIAKDISDRKQAELALVEARDLREAIFNGSADGIFLVELPPTSRIIDCNQRAVELFEAHSKSELIGIEGNTLQKSPFTTKELAATAVEIQNKGFWSQEVEYITKTGRTFWGNLAAKPIQVADQDYWLVRLTDITDRKRAEEALQNSEATKNQILKTIPDLIIWMKSDGTCIDLIDGNNTTNLYVKSEAIGNNLYQLLPPDLAQARKQAIQKALQTGEDQIYEQQVFVLAELRHEEVRVIGVGGDRVLVIVRDITDRKRAEAALLDSEARFRSAFWDAPIGMALIGLDEHWLKVNPMLCDMLAASEADLLSQPVSNRVHPEDVSKLQQGIQTLLFSEGRNAQIELRYYCPQGHIVYSLMSLSLVRSAQAQPLYYVAQIQDITERKAIDRMKNEFISIVSHELRTPLTAIHGFLGLLDMGIYDNKPEQSKRAIKQALTNSERLIRLVNDILNLERLSSGKVQLQKEVCQAEDLLQRAVAGVEPIAEQAKVELAIATNPVQAWADPDAIIQALTNLLSNAIKFSPPHSVITLSAQPQSDVVLFSVKDQGRGIPADKLEIIFGRFQQVDVSDSRQKGGTGLGLAICQSIVQQHGGSIWAQSIPGKGSTFYFTLPLGE